MVKIVLESVLRNHCSTIPWPIGEFLMSPVMMKLKMEFTVLMLFWDVILLFLFQDIILLVVYQPQTSYLHTKNNTGPLRVPHESESVSGN